MKKLVSHSLNQTMAIGEECAMDCRAGEVFAFFGSLGMGKTAFVKGLAKGLGISSDVTSPTFALVNEYRGGKFPLYHFDMYRIATWDDLYSTGYFDYLETDAVLAIEWSENIENALPDNAVFVKILPMEQPDDRCILIGNKEEFDEDIGN